MQGTNRILKKKIIKINERENTLKDKGPRHGAMVVKIMWVSAPDLAGDRMRGHHKKYQGVR